MTMLKCQFFGAKRCDQIWQSFATLANFGMCLRVHLVLGNILNLLWQNMDAIGLIFTILNSQILNKYSTYLVTLVPKWLYTLIVELGTKSVRCHN